MLNFLFLDIKYQCGIFVLIVYLDWINCFIVVEGWVLIQDEVIVFILVWYDVVVIGGVYIVVFIVICLGVWFIQGFCQSIWIY